MMNKYNKTRHKNCAARKDRARSPGRCFCLDSQLANCALSAGGGWTFWRRYSDMAEMVKVCLVILWSSLIANTDISCQLAEEFSSDIAIIRKNCSFVFRCECIPRSNCPLNHSHSI